MRTGLCLGFLVLGVCAPVLAAEGAAVGGAAENAALPAPYLKELTGAGRPAVNVPANLKCYDTEFGWIICESPTKAQSMAADVRAAAATFLQYFGAVPGRGAVVTASSKQTPLAGELERAGATWILPWFDEAAAAAFQEKVNGLKRDRLVAQGFQGAAADRVMAAQPKGNYLAATATLRHELGHVLFLETFWNPQTQHTVSRGSADHGGRYGSPSHDWLDETAAILMENSATTTERRKAFAFAFKADPNRIRPLGEFFKMSHPSVTKAAAPPPSGSKTAGASLKLGSTGFNVNVVSHASGEERRPDPTLDFYAQCRVFADFLVQKSGRQTVFRSIAENEAKGGDMASWLMENGRPLGLPVSVDDLDRQFRAWAKG